MNAALTLDALHVMAKPTGARCNLDCSYCFFLKKDRLYPGGTFRMSDEVLEAYIGRTIEGHRSQEVTVAWQGGEPTLMGLDFFRKAVTLEKRYARPGMNIENTFQTNGVLLDDEWCDFLRNEGLLVGLSLDGPQELHDAYRRGWPAAEVTTILADEERLAAETLSRSFGAAGRNDPCPCGSGLKFKKCHGKV